MKNKLFSLLFFALCSLFALAQPVLDGGERFQVVDGDTIWAPNLNNLKNFVNQGAATYISNDSIFFVTAGADTVFVGFATAGAAATPTFTLRTSAADNTWREVAYGNGLFVAVSSTGSGNRVMTSPDGVNWTSRTSAADNEWYGVAYGNGLFVAVSQTGTGNRVMTSPDGITWTIRTSAADNNWQSLAYGNGLFVAVASSGTANRVMTSPDGITWTIRTSANDYTWNSVSYGNGVFVAVSSSGTGNRVMTSPDGITWTARTSAADNSWTTVRYGNGLFVAVSSSGTGNRVMTSPTGVTWTIRTSAVNNDWDGLAYGNGLWVAVANSGAVQRIMTSPNGITWTARNAPADNDWRSVAYGNGVFASVAASGTGDRVMTNGSQLVAGLPVEIDKNGIYSGSGTVPPNTAVTNFPTFIINSTLTRLVETSFPTHGSGGLGINGYGLNEGGSPPNIFIASSGGFAGSETPFNNIRGLGSLKFAGASGSFPAYITGASIEAISTQSWAGGVRGTRLSLNAIPHGSTSERQEFADMEHRYIRFNNYGAGNKTAASLSKTASAFVNGWATDGTMLDVPISSLGGPNGIYTPTITKNTASDTIVAVRTHLYSATDSIVTLSGSFYVNSATGTAVTSVQVSLPPGLTSNFTNQYEVQGVVTARKDAFPSSLKIAHCIADTANDRINISWETEEPVRQHIHYQIQYVKK